MSCSGLENGFRLNQNSLDSFPEGFTSLTELQSIELGNNRISTVTDSIGSMLRLQILNLSSNKITSLPASIGDLKKLTTFYLKRNPFSKPEQDKVKKLMPNCKVYWD